MIFRPTWQPRQRGGGRQRTLPVWWASASVAANGVDTRGVVGTSVVTAVVHVPLAVFPVETCKHRQRARNTSSSSLSVYQPARVSLNTFRLVCSTQQLGLPLAQTKCHCQCQNGNLYSASQAPKAKAQNTYIAPQAAYCSCSGAFLSQTEWAYNL